MSIAHTVSVGAFLVVALDSHALTVTISKFTDAPCGQALGYLIANPSGGAPPYSYQWSNGANTPVIEFLPPGTYSVTVIDGLGDTATDDEVILVTSSHAPYQGGFSGLVHCPGDNPYAFLYLEDPHHGPEPHNIQTPGTLFGNFSDAYSGMFNYYGMWANVVPGSLITVNWTDGLGCPGSTDVPFSTAFVEPNVQITSVQGACGGNNGRINIAVTGANPMQNFRVNVRTLDGQIPPGQAFQSGSRSVQGNTTFNFASLGPGAYWILTDPDILGTVPNNEGGQLYCVDSMYVEVPDLFGQCAVVSGSVFIDHGQDCLKDANDPGLSYRLIEFMPGEHHAIVNANGGYSCNLPNGSYTMTVNGTGTDLYPICPAVQPIPVVVSGVAQTVNVADSSLVPLDLVASVNAGPARPGFIHNTWMRVNNPSGQASDVVTATLEFDAQMTYVNASPAPSSIVGNVVTWIGLPALYGFDHMDLSVQLQVPPDVQLLGTPYTHLFTASQSFADADPANNTALRTGLFTGSYDPNEKLARTSTGTSNDQYYIDQDEWVDYTINFQNTGTDTAFTVVVRDALPTTLDMGTFEQGLCSHPFTVNFKPGRVVEWRFNNILLPDSGTNEAASHGTINFRIRPHLPLLPGTIIENIANIYFDFNPPVITEPSLLVAEFSTGVGEQASSGMAVYPNPGRDRLIVEHPGLFRARLIDLSGREVRALGSGTERLAADVTDLPSGAYRVVVIGEDGSIRQRLWVRN